jgi:hypothetical protein
MSHFRFPPGRENSLPLTFSNGIFVFVKSFHVVRNFVPTGSSQKL